MKITCCDKEKGLLLHAYELNILSEEEKDIFETHLLECEYCIQQVKEFAPRGILLSTSPKLKSILQTTEIAEKSFFRRIQQYVWSDKLPIIFRPALLIVIILLMSYPTYLGLSHKKNNYPSVLQEIGLIQTRSSDDNNIFIIDKNKETILSFLISPKNEQSKLSIKLKNSDSYIIYKNDNFSGLDSFGVGHLLIPHKLLQNGLYELSVNSNDTIYQFYFNVKIR